MKSLPHLLLVASIAGAPLLACDAKRPQAAQSQACECADLPAQLPTVKLSARAHELGNVTIEQAKQATVGGDVWLPATVTPDPARVAHISALVSGQLASVDVSVGSRIVAEQPLALLRSIELGNARSALARAMANIEVARSNFQRQEELSREGIGSRKEYLEAQAQVRREEAELDSAQRALEVYGKGGRGSNIAIRAPITGQIVARHATVGEVVHPSDELFEITDISKVWIIGNASQKQASKITVGAPATFVAEGFGGRTWTGVVDYIAPNLEAHTRSTQVRMIVDNPDETLKSGVFGELAVGHAPLRNPLAPGSTTDSSTATATTTQTTPTAALPENPMGVQVRDDAIVRIHDQEYLFVPTQQEGEYRSVPVTVRSRYHGLAELISGIEVGDNYVATGTFLLKSEALKLEMAGG